MSLYHDPHQSPGNPSSHAVKSLKLIISILLQIAGSRGKSENDTSTIPGFSGFRPQFY